MPGSFALGLLNPYGVNDGGVISPSGDQSDTAILYSIDTYTADLCSRTGYQYTVNVVPGAATDTLPTSTDGALAHQLAPAAFGIWSNFGVSATPPTATTRAPHHGAGTGNQGGDFPGVVLIDGLIDRGITPAIYMECVGDAIPANILPASTITVAKDVTVSGGNGTYDSYLKQWAADANTVKCRVAKSLGADNDCAAAGTNGVRNLKNRRKSSFILLRLNQEANLEWAPWMAWTPQDYIDVWRYIHFRLRGIDQGHAAHVRMFYCPYDLFPAKARNYYPGDHFCQFVGFDVYNDEGGADRHLYQDWKTRINPGMEVCRLLPRKGGDGAAPGAAGNTKRKFIIGECGLIGNSWGPPGVPNRKKMVTDGLVALRKRSPKLKGLMYYDIYPMQFDSTSSGSKQAWAEKARNDIFQGRYGAGDTVDSQQASYNGPQPEAGATITSSDDGGMDIAVATYQEGTWTPTLTCATVGDLYVSYSVRIGRYTRIGNRVHIQAFISLAGWLHTTASGIFSISGLPFTGASAGWYGWLAGQAGGWTKAGYTQVMPYIEPNTTTCRWYATGSGQTAMSLDVTDLPSGGLPEFYLNGAYEV